MDGRTVLHSGDPRRADASTLSVVNEVKANLAQFQAAVSAGDQDRLRI